MDYEAALNQALDLLADAEDRKAAKLLQACIDDIKSRLKGTDADLEGYYYWGRCLTAMEEYEQALLKFEKVLQIDPDHEGGLWETASIFLHDLERPESARLVLAERLLKLRPDDADYREALRAAEFCIRLSTSPPVPPADAGEEDPPPPDVPRPG